MGSLSVSVAADLSAVLAPMAGAGADDARELLARTVEADMRPYVKHDTGALEASARTASDYRGGEIVYTAKRGGREYAAYAYEDPRVARTDANPRATARWDEAASADRMGEWERVLAEALTGKVSL